MGYSGAELRELAKIAGAAFVPVSGAKTMDLMDIKVTGYDAWQGWSEDGDPIGGAFGEVYVQVLNEYGRNIADYNWFDYDEDGTRYLGWYKDADCEQPLKAGDVVLASGEGLQAYCSEFGFPYQLQSAGQVLTDKDMPTLLRELAKLVANVTPVSVDLKNCYVTGYDPWQGWSEDGDPIGGAFGEVYIQVLNEYGRNIADYNWFDYDEDGVPYCGWYKDADCEQPLKAGDVVIGPGEGIQAYCSEFNFPYQFVWPKVDVK